MQKQKWSCTAYDAKINIEYNTIYKELKILVSLNLFSSSKKSMYLKFYCFYIDLLMGNHIFQSDSMCLERNAVILKA